MPRRRSSPFRRKSIALLAIPALSLAPITCSFDQSAPTAPDPTTTPSETKRLRISIEVDGQHQEKVKVPQGLFDGGWTTNLTQREIGGGVEAGRKRGSNLYPKGSLGEFDLAPYLSAVSNAARTHAPANASGVATLDFEGGLYPWADRARDTYKQGISDAEFERLSHQFFLRSLNAAKSARPNAKWGYWGYPRTWQNKELIRRMKDIYAQCDALAPSLYVTRSGDAGAIRKFVADAGKRIEWIKELHPRPESVVVAAYIWDRNASIDHRQPRALASQEDLLTTARAAEQWADQLVIWVAAGSEAEAAQLTRSLAPGGHLRNFIEAYRNGR